MEGTLLSILVTNHFGVLTKITGLFSRRGFNIKALSVGETDDPTISRVTVLTEGDEQKLNQIYAQVSKLEDVKAAVLLKENEALECGIALVKINPAEGREDLYKVARERNAEVVEIADGCVIVRIVGGMAEIETTIAALKRFGIMELSRTGPTALDVTDHSLVNQRRNFEC